jgi:hypothetical protein
VNGIDDLRYLRGRVVQEQQAAQAARTAAARTCHQQLAARYEALAMLLAINLQLSGAAQPRILGMSSLG